MVVGDIHHADLFALIENRRAGRRQKKHGEKPGGSDAVLSFGAVIGHLARGIVVGKMLRFPAALLLHLIPGFLDSSKVFRSHDRLRAAGQFEMVDRIELFPFLSDEARRIFRIHACAFADREHITGSKHFFMHLMDDLMDPRDVRAHFLVHDEAVPVQEDIRLLLGVREAFRLLKARENVQTEAVHAHIRPETKHFVDLFPKRRIFPVQVRHFHGILMQIILSGRCVKFPGGAPSFAEIAPPVVGFGTVGLRRLPDIIVPVGIVFGLSGFAEPEMLVGAVIQHLVHDDADPHRMRGVEDSFEIVHGPVGRIDGAVIRHVIAVVDLRRTIDRGEPDAADPEFFEHRKLL